MPRYYLTLTEPHGDGEPCSVTLCEGQCDIPEGGGSVRTSPIYRAFCDGSGHMPLQNGTGYVLLLFTLDAFYALGCIHHRFDGSPTLRDAFLTHGLASILFLSESPDGFPEIVTLLEDVINGYEIWHVSDNILTRAEAKVFGHNSELAGQGIGLPPQIDRLDHDDAIITADLFRSLCSAYQFARAYAPQYSELLDAVFLDMRSIVAALVYLQDQASEDEVREVMIDLYQNQSELDSTLADLASAKANINTRHITIHQLKDELVQLSAVLRTLDLQAFGGASPIARRPAEPGRTSLFGIGGAFAALFAFYRHVRSVFSEFVVDRAIRDRFPSMSSPPLQENPAEYEAWLELVKHSPHKGIDAALSGENSPKDITFHLVYFSNRLGFRETKHSISAAYQALFLGALPPWSLCTLTHEYLHAHNRAMLANLYPWSCEDSGTFDAAYAKYASCQQGTSSPDVLLDFLQLVLMQTAHKLHVTTGNSETADSSTAMSRCPPAEKLREALRTYHPQIDEVMVHVLDYHYFYDADPQTYIRAIWMSWLVLPFVITRIPEYLMRTICAVASNHSGTRKERFNWCLKKIRSELLALKGAACIADSKIDLVIEQIDNDDVKRHLAEQFWEAWTPLVDVTHHFLVSEKIKTGLMDEPEQVVQPDDSYSYELEPMEFEKRRISSPALFMVWTLKGLLKRMLREDFDICEAERYTIWMLYAMSSSLSRC